MRTFDKTWLMTTVVAEMRRRAKQESLTPWADQRRVLERCKAYHQPTGTILLFSRDEGHHESGWWKNPDYERCEHLSLSFRDPTTGQIAPRDVKRTREWLGYFFGGDVKKLWCEPPYSPEGKAIEIWHYRLFCAPNWTPIIPRGEVYNRELTEAGWLSYSDMEAAIADQVERFRERAAT